MNASVSGAARARAPMARIKRLNPRKVKTMKATPNAKRNGSVYFGAMPSERISGSVEPPVSKLASSIRYEATNAPRNQRRSRGAISAPLRRANIINSP